MENVGASRAPVGFLFQIECFADAICLLSNKVNAGTRQNVTALMK